MARAPGGNQRSCDGGRSGGNEKPGGATGWAKLPDAEGPAGPKTQKARPIRATRHAAGPAGPLRSSATGRQPATASSPSRLRVWVGSTGMPGPMVVAKNTFFRYRPLAADGLARSTSSRAAA